MRRVSAQLLIPCTACSDRQLALCSKLGCVRLRAAALPPALIAVAALQAERVEHLLACTAAVEAYRPDPPPAAVLPVAGAVQADKLAQMVSGGGDLPSNSLLNGK